MDDDNQEIPLNATIRQEYVKCGDPVKTHMARIFMRIGNKIRN